MAEPPQTETPAPPPRSSILQDESGKATSEMEPSGNEAPPGWDGVQEMDSLCMACHETAQTRLLLVVRSASSTGRPNTGILAYFFMAAPDSAHLALPGDGCMGARLLFVGAQGACAPAR